MDADISLILSHCFHRTASCIKVILSVVTKKLKNEAIDQTKEFISLTKETEWVIFQVIIQGPRLILSSALLSLTNGLQIHHALLH